MKKIWLKRCQKIFSLLLAVLLFAGLAQTFYLRQFDKNQLRLDGFYMEDQDTLDVVFLGASEVYTGFSSAAAYEQFGFTSYPYSFESNPVSLWKSELREILSRQTPQVLVVEINGVLYNEKELYKEASNRYLIDNMPMSKNKIDTIRSLKSGEDPLSYYFPIIKYHGKWMNVRTNILGAIDTVTLKKRGYSLLKGMTSNTGDPKQEELMDVSADVSSRELNPEAENYFREFLDECRNSGIENILFVRFPHRIASDGEYKRFQRSNRVGEIVGEYGFEFLNMETMKDVLGLDMEKDFYNADHLNIYGQQKLTAWMGKYLMAHYPIEPCDLTEKEQKQWEKSAHYTQLFYEYFDKLKKENAGEAKKLKESADLIKELEKLDQ